MESIPRSSSVRSIPAAVNRVIHKCRSLARPTRRSTAPLTYYPNKAGQYELPGDSVTLSLELDGRIAAAEMSTAREVCELPGDVGGKVQQSCVVVPLNSIAISPLDNTATSSTMGSVESLMQNSGLDISNMMPESVSEQCPPQYEYSLPYEAYRPTGFKTVAEHVAACDHSSQLESRDQHSRNHGSTTSAGARYLVSASPDGGQQNYGLLSSPMQSPTESWSPQLYDTSPSAPLVENHGFVARPTQPPASNLQTPIRIRPKVGSPESSSSLAEQHQQYVPSLVTAWQATNQPGLSNHIVAEMSHCGCYAGPPPGSGRRVHQQERPTIGLPTSSNNARILWSPSQQYLLEYLLATARIHHSNLPQQALALMPSLCQCPDEAVKAGFEAFWRILEGNIILKQDDVSNFLFLAFTLGIVHNGPALVEHTDVFVSEARRWTQSLGSDPPTVGLRTAVEQTWIPTFTRNAENPTLFTTASTDQLPTAFVPVPVEDPLLDCHPSSKDVCSVPAQGSFCHLGKLYQPSIAFVMRYRNQSAPASWEGSFLAVGLQFMLGEYTMQRTRLRLSCSLTSPQSSAVLACAQSQSFKPVPLLRFRGSHQGSHTQLLNSS